MDVERERDAAALAAVVRCDEAAFREIYDRHRTGIYRLAYGILLDREEAREVVQENSGSKQFSRAIYQSLLVTCRLHGIDPDTPNFPWFR